MPEKQFNNQKWINVIALFFLLAVTWGITFNSGGMFTAPVQKTLGVARSEILMTFTYKGVAMVIGTILTGVLLKKFKVLNVMRVGGIVLFINYILMSRITSLPQYFFVSSMHVLGTTMTGFIPSSLIIHQWFGKKSGAALGIAFMGSGFGGMFFNILGGSLIAGRDWRFAALVIALIMLAVIVLSSFLLIREAPKDYVPAGDELAEGEAPTEVTGIILNDAMKKPSFWMITLSLFILSIAMNAIVANVSPALVDLGYSISFASTVTGLCFVGMSLGKAITGVSMDRFGVKFTSVAGTVGLAIGFAGLLFGRMPLGIIIIIASFLFGTPMGSLGVPAFTSTLYGMKDYAGIQSFLQTSFSLGSIAGPIIMSILFARFGNYDASWILFFSLTLLSALIMFFLLPAHKKVKVSDPPV